MNFKQFDELADCCNMIDEEHMKLKITPFLIMGKSCYATCGPCGFVMITSLLCGVCGMIWHIPTFVRT